MLSEHRLRNQPARQVSVAGQCDEPRLSASHFLLAHHTPPSKIPATTHVIVLAVEEAKKLGIMPAEVLSGARLRLEDLSLPSLVLSREQELRVFANLQSLTGDETVGLEIGQRVHVSGFGLPGYTMQVSETIHDAISCMQQFPLLMGLYHTVAIETAPQLTSVTIGNYSYSPTLELMATDMCLAAIKTVVSDLLGRSVSAEQVTVRYPEPSPLLRDKHCSFYGCDVSYGAEKDSITFTSPIFEAKAPLANRVSFLALHAQCADMESQWASRASEDCLVQVRSLIEMNLTEYCSLSRLAAKMCVTERTLRRRLVQQGTSFQQVLDQVRHERASQLLAHPASRISVIAQELGYSDAVSFRHAFRRWTGLTPTEFRTACTVK